MNRFALDIDPSYREAFTGILSFASFEAAEMTLKRLENLRLKYHSASDKKGVAYCRQIALLGRRRAEFISRNRRVSPKKRRQKREIAAWFGVWLETPAIFDNWLALRKKTEEFQELLQSEIQEGSPSGDLHASGFKAT